MNFKTINLNIFNWLNIEPKEEKKIDFAVGGQAVIEGVMMRSHNHITIAVRKKNGEIKVNKRKYQTLTQRYKWLNLPILRGIINLFEMMAVGAKAINFSANEMLEDEMTEEEKEKIRNQKKSTSTKILEYSMFVLSLIVAIALSIFLFKFIPLGLATLLQEYIPYLKENYLVFNLIDGALKMLMFLLYIYLLSLLPSFKRVFEYHGAEHKSIFTYENKLPHTPDNAKKQTRFHPRCGTSFILIVFIISILVYTLIPRQPTFWQNFSVRIGFLPLIAGISYEYLKISAKHAKNIFIRAMIAPGLWFQRLTTKEPDLKQLEVGLKSLDEALILEKAP